MEIGLRLGGVQVELDAILALGLELCRPRAKPGAILSLIATVVAVARLKKLIVFTSMSKQFGVGDVGDGLGEILP